jgi:hypothetical protein
MPALFAEAEIQLIGVLTLRAEFQREVITTFLTEIKGWWVGVPAVGAELATQLITTVLAEFSFIGVGIITIQTSHNPRLLFQCFC